MVATRPSPPSSVPVAPPVQTLCGDWVLQEYAVVGSTNLVAADLAAWTAVRADHQTGGRGRFQRTWVSDRGGLWLSAVVPIEDDVLGRRALPLAAGVAVCEVVEQLGVSGVRLRWPNDVMLREQKLAGLLVDQFKPGLAVVGIGLNVTNQPEGLDPTLTNRVAHLADVISTPPPLTSLASQVLSRLRSLLVVLNQEGAPALFERANQRWGPPRPVELDLDGVTRHGLFTGVDSLGRLILADSLGRSAFYEAHEVRHLTET